MFTATIKYLITLIDKNEFIKFFKKLLLFNKWQFYNMFTSNDLFDLTFFKQKYIHILHLLIQNVSKKNYLFSVVSLVSSADCIFSSTFSATSSSWSSCFFIFDGKLSTINKKKSFFWYDLNKNK